MDGCLFQVTANVRDCQNRGRPKDVYNTEMAYQRRAWIFLPGAYSLSSFIVVLVFFKDFQRSPFAESQWERAREKQQVHLKNGFTVVKVYPIPPPPAPSSKSQNLLLKRSSLHLLQIFSLGYWHTMASLTIRCHEAKREKKWGGKSKRIQGTNKKKNKQQNITGNQQYMCYLVFSFKREGCLRSFYFSFCFVDRGFCGPCLGLHLELHLLVGWWGVWGGIV